jgi:hydrogenase maturation protein HypF
MISRALPYARERTSFKPFVACAKCRKEMALADDRQHLNEIVACPKCGPQLALLDAFGQSLPGDPVEQTVALLEQGKIVALKGYGGFHLVCDARNARAVDALRQRRRNDAKPYPVMFANAISASAFVQLGVGEPGLLAMPERPIILLKKRPRCDAELPGVGAGVAWLGVMMPFNSLQHLLFHQAAGCPEGLGWLDSAQALALVMIGTDFGGEPPVLGNDEALRRLSGVADAFLLHDQEIVSVCDDSIARSAPGGLQLIRRARGYVTRAVRLSHAGPPVLAVGGGLKNTVCVTRGDEAFVSQHIGDLDNPQSCAFFDDSIAHFLSLLDVKPALVAHDSDRRLHSSQFAIDLARQRGVPTLAVGHDHAHAAAVLAEHRIDAPAVALVLDGTGGDDDGGRGGELFSVDGLSIAQLGRLQALELVGGDKRRQPWHLAASVLHRLGRGAEIMPRFAAQVDAPAVAHSLADGRSGGVSSSLSAYVTAAAGLLGIAATTAFDGQAAMLLEGLAEQHGDVPPLHDGWIIRDACLDLLPLLAALADEENAGRGAALFHATLVAALAEWIAGVVANDSTIVGSGCGFQNLLLARGLRSRLGARGLHLIEAHHLPSNDGGLALGQAWVAQRYLLD